jgi:hypothetical protein
MFIVHLRLVSSLETGPLSLLRLALILTGVMVEEHVVPIIILFLRADSHLSIK